MYRIILVDDEPLILAGIASLIQWESLGCTLVGKATNGPNALELIRETQPDIVITDIRMPVMDGLELIGRCREEGMEFSFIVLTNLEEFHLARHGTPGGRGLSGKAGPVPGFPYLRPKTGQGGMRPAGEPPQPGTVRPFN